MYRTRDRSESTPLRKVTLGVAAAVGFFCGFYYFRRGDLAITALYLTAGALILSLTVAGWGLVLAIIAALGVPLAYAAMGIAGVRIFYPPEPNLAATLLALLPTVTGAMMGLGLRWVFFGESGAPVSR